jgi:Enoyl-(Acyl carrier protein) reductase
VQHGLGELSTTNVEQARHAFDLRFWGAFMAAKYGSSQMRPGGSNVLTSGTAGRRPHKGWTVGAAILGAVEALTRALAVELAPIRVNAVCPGPVRTEMWMSLPEEDREATFRGIGQALPVGRVGEAHDLAHAYLYLMREGCEHRSGDHRGWWDDLGLKHRFGEKGQDHIIHARTGCSYAKNSLSLLVSVMGDTASHEPPEFTTAACNSSREAFGFSNNQPCPFRDGCAVQYSGQMCRFGNWPNLGESTSVAAVLPFFPCSEKDVRQIRSSPSLPGEYASRRAIDHFPAPS